MRKTISIIIVAWNSAANMPRCLECLSSQTFRDFEVRIIDNGSVDGGLDRVLETYPSLEIHIERLSSNIGFSAANNIGAHIAKSKWLVLLNADAFPEPNWLENLIASANAHPEMTSFASRQIQAGNQEILDGAGDAYHVSGLAWRRYIGYPAKKYGHETAEIFSPCAAASMYLQSAFLDVGGFDKDFFSYFEDVDLGFRLQLRGYRCLYVPKAVVHHVGSSTFGERSDFAFYHTHRNMIWTFIKNMPFKLLWRYLPAHIVANLIYLLYYSVRGRGKVLWKAKWDAIKKLPKFIRKRHETQQNITIALSDLEQLMEHGWLKPYLLDLNRRNAVRKLKR